MTQKVRCIPIDGAPPFDIDPDTPIRWYGEIIGTAIEIAKDGTPSIVELGLFGAQDIRLELVDD